MGVMEIDAASEQLAQRTGAKAVLALLAGVHVLSPSLYEVTLRGCSAIAGSPGQDLMLTIPDGERNVRRRFSVRSVDVDQDTVTLWIARHDDGVAAQWLAQTTADSPLIVIGPRGKIPLDAMADWHLFVGDVTALGAFYALAQSIDPPGRAIFIVEIDEAADALTATFDPGIGLTGIFIDRDGRARDDATGLLSGLSAFALPPGEGHAYVFGEFSVVRTVRSALEDRGLDPSAISHKAFYRAGRSNQDHGEPQKD